MYIYHFDSLDGSICFIPGQLSRSKSNAFPKPMTNLPLVGVNLNTRKSSRSLKTVMMEPNETANLSTIPSHSALPRSSMTTSHSKDDLVRANSCEVSLSSATKRALTRGFARKCAVCSDKSLTNYTYVYSTRIYNVRKRK